MKISLPSDAWFHTPSRKEFVPSTHNVRMIIGLMRIDLRFPDELVEKTDILAKLDEIARKRDWLGRPIYRYGMKYFDEGLSNS